MDCRFTSGSARSTKSLYNSTSYKVKRSSNRSVHTTKTASSHHNAPSTSSRHSMCRKFNDYYGGIHDGEDSNVGEYRQEDNDVSRITNLQQHADQRIDSYDNFDKLTSEMSNNDRGNSNNFNSRTNEDSRKNSASTIDGSGDEIHSNKESLHTRQENQNYDCHTNKEKMNTSQNDTLNERASLHLPQTLHNLFSLWLIANEGRDGWEKDTIEPTYSKALGMYLERCKTLHSEEDPKALYHYVRGLDFLRRTPEAFPAGFQSSPNDLYCQVLEIYLKSITNSLDS